MTYQNTKLLTEFTNEEHKKLYYENLYSIFGINDIEIIKKILNQ